MSVWCVPLCPLLQAFVWLWCWSSQHKVPSLQLPHQPLPPLQFVRLLSPAITTFNLCLLRQPAPKHGRGRGCFVNWGNPLLTSTDWFFFFWTTHILTGLFFSLIQFLFFHICLCFCSGFNSLLFCGILILLPNLFFLKVKHWNSYYWVSQIYYFYLHQGLSLSPFTTTI